ncbi:MAG: LPS export ABC transporter periplasmic protein LptC [Tannerella sp.]|jgi:LPS export ABC transporter protein LptC|nr:LPS export ABC transporter periplasmic protein LptC [Tannerella sp.]
MFLIKNEQDIAIFFKAIAMSLFMTISCHSEKKELVEVVFDREHTPTMKATDVSTLISDSGLVRYKMVTSEWLYYEEASDPYWYFPEKVHVEKFDTLFRIEASIDADTAYYFTKRRVWKLVGNVDVENMEGERFETSLLYWDQNTEKIYSDQFIRITKGDFVNTGIGFESNQTLTRWQIYQAGAIIPVREKTGQDTINITKDTIIAENPPPE